MAARVEVGIDRAKQCPMARFVGCGENGVMVGSVAVIQLVLWMVFANHEVCVKRTTTAPVYRHTRESGYPVRHSNQWF